MASIHKNPKSPFYYCAYNDVDGKRVFKSTKQTKNSDAWRVAHALEDAARDARQGAITSAHMSKIIASTVAKLYPDNRVLTSAREWFDSWANDVATSKAPGTGKRYKGIVTEFLSSIGKKADQPLTTLNKIDIQGFQESKLRSGLSRSSVNMIVKTLRACLGMAVKQELLTTNPANAVSLIQRDNDTDESFKEDFTDEQVQALLLAAPTWEWKGIILVGYYVGSRIQNCSSLRRDQIDRVKQVIRYTPVKQRGKRNPLELPIHPVLDAFFSETLPLTSGEYIFPTLNEMPVEGESGLSRAFRRIIDAAGITYKTKLPKGKSGRKVFSLGFHSFRRTFNSRLANAGVSQEIRQRLIGHASEEVNDGYTHVQMETFREAINKLPSVRQAFPQDRGGK